MNRGLAVIVALLLATSAVGAAFGAGAGASTGAESSTTTDGETETASAATAGGEAYAGTHVAFDVEGDAVTDYRIGGDETFSSVAVQSTSEAGAGADLGAEIDLETLTTLEGAGLSLAAQSETSAQVQAESGATLSAHDTERGTLVVESGSESQYVRVELAADATASDEGDRVRVETGDHEGTVLVVGDGEVTVTDDGNVTAELAENATLTFRSYEDGERDETDEYEESLIADGNAAVEVHVEDRNSEAVGEAVTYGQETSAEVETEARDRVDVTIDRATHEGTVVLTTVSEEAVGSLEDLEVRIDGEAATEVSSKSELEGAIGSDESRYMVAQQSEASAEATVYIAVNHFSERTATIDGADGDDSDGGADGTDDSDETDGTDGDDSGTDDETDATAEDGTTDGSESDADGSDADDGEESDAGADGGDGMPGFGVGVAVVAIAVAGLFARLQD
ncbi:PGF-CTERM sorting domain-containing protein [Haloterrigena sp. SYSU A121-1]|uniref:PGF-CTERM sorting domain-containing protein n=1 Tax=Haloterrigena gelatinilytica TaxID=2741724 RepID=A0A8J8GHY7_9EURY|nr:PGF-CTERM sorting domain-containing protein [Haloterrigena gelatinilytica]NUB89520.1 PGF-CTERM sorting domain-containing protein [Haloterrigena gelatinilytica]